MSPSVFYFFRLRAPLHLHLRSAKLRPGRSGPAFLRIVLLIFVCARSREDKTDSIQV